MASDETEKKDPDKISPEKRALLIKAWEESWRQFNHEDKYKQENNRFYASLEFGLLTIILVLASWIIKGESITGPSVLSLIFGCIAIVVSIFGLKVCHVWLSETETAGKAARLHWVNAIVVEHELGIYNLGPASVESKWRAQLGQEPVDGYDPFPEHTWLDKRKIFAIESRLVGGSENIVRWVRIAWRFWLSVGVLAIILSCVLALR